MEMTFQTFMEKIKQIKEINIYSNYGGIKYDISTNNQELKQHIKKVLNQIDITNMYKINGIMYEQKIIDEIIDAIKNMESYNDLEKLYQNPIVDEDYCKIVHYSKKNIKAFKLDFLTKQLKQFMLEKIKNIDNITIKEESEYSIYIQNDIIAMKEECKYDCKTNIRMHEIEQIFNLNN